MLRDRRVAILLVASVVGLAVLLAALIGLGADDRVITGAPAWLKPLKFGVSIAVYTATLAWLLTLVEGHWWLVRLVAWTTGAALIAEFVLLLIQVVRGTTSHFNTASPFDAAVFRAMGGLITAVFLAAAVAALLLALQRGLPPVLASGIRGGLLVSLLGMAAAVLMLANTGIDPGGAHTVGALDGGPGLPLTGWSTEHGDLRVPHFVGLHGLQALPLLAWALTRYAGALTERTQVLLVRLGSTACAGVVVLLAWQAERGLPLLRPDAAVSLVGAAGALAVGAVASLLVVRGRR